METNKQFNILSVSSKIGICGMLLRGDTYRGCSFGCRYCFSENRVMMANNQFATGNISQLEKLFKSIFDDKKYNEAKLLNKLIAKRYPVHCGGLSDPFQPFEEKYKITSRLIDLSNRYKLPIVFSTKSDTVFGANIRPELHSFQLSVTNIKNDKYLEPNVPTFEKRLEFFKRLKADGFSVGIRIQPFLPGLTEPDIIDIFKDADCITIEGLKLVPQLKNNERNEELRKLTGLTKEDFYMFGQFNMKPELKLKLYKPFIDRLIKNGTRFAIADNDLRWLGTEQCCCGDRVARKFTSFNTTTMIHNNGLNYTLYDVIKAADDDGLLNGTCKGVFPSNRQKGVITVEDYLTRNFNSKNNPTCPRSQYFSANNDIKTLPKPAV